MLVEIIKYSMDLSYVLEIVFNKQFFSSFQDVFGEFQFVFVCFLLGNVYEVFEYWKWFLNFLCWLEVVMMKYYIFYINFIFILYYQFGEIFVDFFVDIVF